MLAPGSLQMAIAGESLPLLSRETCERTGDNFTGKIADGQTRVICRPEVLGLGDDIPTWPVRTFKIAMPFLLKMRVFGWSRSTSGRNTCLRAPSKPPCPICRLAGEACRPGPPSAMGHRTHWRY